MKLNQAPRCEHCSYMPALAYSVASVTAAWLLLSWVLFFADARGRAMRPFLWVLVAALFPHLLGFLLYFVMRQPIASTCSHCGRTIALNQLFCSWCGSPTARVGFGQRANRDQGPSGPDSMATV